MRVVCRDLDVAWFEWGRGEPLVLVHGLGDDHRAWRHLVAGQAHERRLIAYDVRGHGQTSLGQPDGTLAQLSGDLAALLDALELAQVDLCGFSMGGTIVLRTAIDHPERVRRLLPVATSSRVGRAAAEWYLARIEGAGPGVANGCRAMAALRQAPLDPELGRIQAPTLVIAGENDELCPPRAAEIIVAGIPSARMEVIAGSGHHFEAERPAELSQAIRGFLGAPE